MIPIRQQFNTKSLSLQLLLVKQQSSRSIARKKGKIGFTVRTRDISLILGVKKDHFLGTILKPHEKNKHYTKVANKSYSHPHMGYDEAVW
jgi:hypothetical protein